MTNRLYIGNLPNDVTEQKLNDLFSQAGEITSVDVILDKATGKSKGFAFVEMATDAASEDAVKRFDGYSLDDRAIIVNVARPREERPAGGSSRN